MLRVLAPCLGPLTMPPSLGGDAGLPTMLVEVLELCPCWVSAKSLTPFGHWSWFYLLPPGFVPSVPGSMLGPLFPVPMLCDSFGLVPVAALLPLAT